MLGVIILIGCVYSFSQSPGDAPLVELLLFSILVLLAEVVPTMIPGTDIWMTMTMPLAISVFLTRGMVPVIAFISIPTFLASLITQRKRQFRSLMALSVFNLANFIVSISLASVAYYLVGGKTLNVGGKFELGSIVLPLMLWIAVYSGVAVVICVTGLFKPSEWKVLLFDSLKWCIPSYIFAVPFSLLFAWVYLSFLNELGTGIPGILLLIFPLLAGRNALNLYAEQTNTYRETIATLGSYMQHYHAYTRGHLERVASLSDMIAKQIGLSAQSLMLIKDAGLLHDIGKVGVSEDVLDKPGQLSDEDWGIIKKHPARGAEILSKMKYLEPIVPWVRSHHERPDGRGYPDGLEGESIPLEASVIAVADAYDAMTGGPERKDQRLYRQPLTLDQAMDQVRYGAGTQFDPRVVKAFMQVMELEDSEHGN